MIAWDYCNESLCMLLILFMVTSQQSIDDKLDSRHQPPASKFDEPESSKISRNEQSRKVASPQSPAVAVIPVDDYEEDPVQILEHPNLVSQIEAQLQDNDNLEGNEYQDQQQIKQNKSIDDVIQQVFSPNSIEEYKNRDLIDNPHPQSELAMNLKKEDSDNLKQSFPQSNPYKRIVTKGGQPGRNILKRKLLLKRLKSPMFRSGQPNSDSKGEQSSEELLHNILESIDQENSENGNPIKNAFLTKTTTYNISKLHEDGRNRRFLIEKLVNYSTNINMLHSENIPTNYSDTHSSVLQTVLNLGQHDKNTDDIINNEENGKQSYSSSENENNLSNNIVGSQVKLDGSNEDSKILKKSPENHHTPTEFLGGQYLQLQNKSPFIFSKQADSKNSNELGSSDFVGGQFIGMANEKDSNSLESKDLKTNPLDFVGGQFVEQPLNLEKKPSGTPSLDFENISETDVGHQTATEDNVTPTTVTDQPPTYNTNIPSLSLTKELLDVKESKNQSSSNVLKNRGKLEQHITSEEAVDNKAVNTPKNPYGSNKIITTEGEKNMLPKSNIKADKQNSLHSSGIDGNSNPQLNDMYPLNSVLGETEIQSDSGYESTTITDEIQDKVEIVPGDEKMPFKPDEFQMKKKNQVSTAPKPVFDDNYKKPSKAISAKTKIMINSIGNKPRSEISGFNNEQIIKDPLETTSAIDYESLFDNSSLTSERHEDVKKSSSVTENEEVLLKSEEVADLPEASHVSPQNSSNLKSNNIFLVGLPMSNEEDNKSSEKGVEGQSSTTPEERELFSRENEEYFVGLKPNSYKSILKTDPETGELITGVGDYNPSKYTTQVNGFEELESVTTIEPLSNIKILLPHSDGEVDQVIGEASDIQQSKLGSGSINTESQDGLSSEKQLSQEQNITNLVDEVELYAGKSTVSEPVSEDQTTQHYESGTGDIYKHPYGIVSSDSNSEENTTQLCLPLTKKNYPKLLDLLSGKLFLEKDGRKINLQLKDNPMKNCNSGTKICKLYFDLKESNKPSISEEMFEIPEDKKNTKDSNSKSKNGKRHINEEYAELMIPNQKSEINTPETSGKNTVRTEMKDKSSHKNEDVILLTVNNPAINQSVSDFSQTEISGFTKAPSSIKLLPVQSMFVRLPVPYKTHFGDQNSHKVTNDNERKIASQINGEKITLHNLDSPYHKFGYPSGNQLARKIHQKRDSHGHLGGACGCNNPLLLSPSPVPDFRHFVGKRLAILTNIVHTVKDWATQDSLRP